MSRKRTTTDVHPRDAGPVANAAWRKKLALAQRAAHARRRRIRLTPREFGRAAFIGLGAVYGLIERGELPVVTIGARRFIPKEALKAFLAKRDAA